MFLFCFKFSLLKHKWKFNRFRQLKEEKKKKVSEALPAEEVQTLDSASDSDEESDEETNGKVNF